MTVANKAQELLDPHALPLPLRPHVLQINVEDYVDASGDDALRVNVLIGDDTKDEELGEATFQIRLAIHDRLRQEGIELWPYVFFAMPSELAEAEAEEENS